MSDDIKVDKVFDLKGLPCPMPVVKVSKGIKEVEIGQVIEAQSTDPGSLTDFPAWARTSGNEILKTEQDDDELIFRVSASGEEYCEECRGMNSRVVNNEVSDTPRIYERASKKPRPAQRKKNKERWSYDQENSE